MKKILFTSLFYIRYSLFDIHFFALSFQLPPPKKKGITLSYQHILLISQIRALNTFNHKKPQTVIAKQPTSKSGTNL
jgi:hypothetical protein